MQLSGYHKVDTEELPVYDPSGHYMNKTGAKVYVKGAHIPLEDHADSCDCPSDKLHKLQQMTGRHPMDQMHPQMMQSQMADDQYVMSGKQSGWEMDSGEDSWMDTLGSMTSTPAPSPVVPSSCPVNSSDYHFVGSKSKPWMTLEKKNIWVTVGLIILALILIGLIFGWVRCETVTKKTYVRTRSDV